jgi:hypothetical protein
MRSDVLVQPGNALPPLRGGDLKGMRVYRSPLRLRNRAIERRPTPLSPVKRNAARDPALPAPRVGRTEEFEVVPEYADVGVSSSRVRRNAGQVSRLLKRLRLHGFIMKVGHTYRYYLTHFGKRNHRCRAKTQTAGAHSPVRLQPAVVTQLLPV